MSKIQRKQEIDWIHSVAGYSKAWLENMSNERVYAIRKTVEKKYGTMPRNYVAKSEKLPIYSGSILIQTTLF